MNQLSEDELESQITCVRECRKAYDDLKAQTFALEAELNVKYRQLYDARNAALSKVSEEEAFLRELTVTAYLADGNKKPAPGVGIRMVKTVEYDRHEAYLFALKSGTCLSLDAKAFEAMIKKADPLAVPSWVKIMDAPQATIAKEL